MHDNHLKSLLLQGKSALGTWCIIPSAVSVDILASCGLDFVIIDAEHGPIDFPTAQNMAIAADSRGVSPVMRVGGVIESDILKALDIGMHGIQIPNIEQIAQAQDLIRFSKYPPMGNRGFSPFTRAGGYTNLNNSELTGQANDNILNIVNIEGKEGIENLDAFLELPEINVFFIGLFDISKTLGIPGQTNDPSVLSTLDTLTKRIRNAGKVAGTITTDSSQLKTFSKMGLQYLVHLVDCDMLKKSYVDVVEQFKSLS